MKDGPGCRAVLLLGPTGAGKTPLGEALEAKGLGGRRCAHFDFGANLRRAAAVGGAGAGLNEDQLAVVRRSLETGALLEDRDFPIAERILRAFLDERAVGPRDLVVLNGLPRHAGQARGVDRIVAMEAVIALECEAGAVAERIRRDTGGDRAGRVDDSPAEIRNKLRIYAERTRPLVDHYRQAGTRVLTLAAGVDTTPETAWRELERLWSP